MDRSLKSACRSAAAIALLIAAQQAHAAKRAAAEALPRDVSLMLPVEAESGRAASLSEPIPGALITSSFGWRKSPVLKHVRFHAGVDFGAAAGTPVLAAGAGIVEKIGRSSDRGRYLVIRHNDRLSSSYAHLSAIEPGLRAGDHVDARAVIGKVGRSGWTTGPNLHFEVFLDGFRVDPVAMLAAGHGLLLAVGADAAPMPAPDTAVTASMRGAGLAPLGSGANANRIAAFNDR